MRLFGVYSVSERPRRGFLLGEDCAPSASSNSVTNFVFGGITHSHFTMRFIDYLRDTKAEMRHVTWPSPAQAIGYTIIVLVLSIGTGIFLGVLDFGFAKGLARFIN